MRKDKYDSVSWGHLLPSSEDEICIENLDLFFKTMYERQEIWYKRFLKQPSPWTENEILRDNKFTNVYRELDRQSQYLISNIILSYEKCEKLVGDKADNIFYYLMFFRLFNNSDFFEFLKKQPEYDGKIPSSKDYNPEIFLNLMSEARKAGINPFTNAYLTNSVACPGVTRDHCFSYTVIPNMIHVSRSLQECFRVGTALDVISLLETIPSVSSFLSHEFFQDFTYIERYTGQKVFPYNQNDYTNVGPGCEVGIRLVLPSKSTKTEKLIGIYELRDLSSDYLNQFGSFKYLKFDIKKQSYYVEEGRGSLTLHQIEMWLCEFQKYWKMMVGEGKQRSKIKSESEKDYSFYLY